MEIVGGINCRGDLVVGSEAVQVRNHVTCHRDGSEMVGVDDGVSVDRVERASACTIGDLGNAYGTNRAGGHGVCPVTAGDMVHCPEGEVTVSANSLLVNSTII